MDKMIDTQTLKEFRTIAIYGAVGTGKTSLAFSGIGCFDFGR